jgi:hypothetical protein
MRKGPLQISFAIIGCLMLAGSITVASGQGGGGRSESIRTPSDVDGRRISRHSKRNLNRSRVSAPRIPLPETGTIVIGVSEGQSQIQILSNDSPIETIDLAERSGSLIIRQLDVGAYTILAKKPGFYDESRTVEIERNQGRRVSIDLRPKMATLSVSSNLPDARISISNVGDFERPVEKILVEPGIYSVHISRRGYLSRRVTADLQSAGSEERLNLILEPVRVDAVLQLAFTHINSEKLSDAEALASDVLAFNPKHARANLALGLVHLGRGETVKAVARLLQAIRSGETFSLPASVRIEPADPKTVAAMIKIDARSLRFESSERPGLNFSITRTNLGRVDIVDDSMIISGHAEYHGRTISPRLQVYLENPETVRTLLSEWQR